MAAASRTAQYVALYRALETIEQSREPLFQDPFATNFLSRPLSLLVRMVGRAGPRLHSLVNRYADYRAPGARSSAIGRTRFIDDVIASATSKVDQLVILGAGFDCRAHRMPSLADVKVFEVDREETQAQKRSGLTNIAEAELNVRDDVRYIAVDFLRDRPSAIGSKLEAAGWDPKKPSIFLWEGVTNYLSEGAVTDVLGWIGSSTAPGTLLVFTYIHAGLLDGSTSFEGGAQMMENVRRLGEPWRFGIEPSKLESFVAPFGFSVRENLGANEYRRRFSSSSSKQEDGYAFYRLAVVANANANTND